jgi:hypothetical protein
MPSLVEDKPLSLLASSVTKAIVSDAHRQQEVCPVIGSHHLMIRYIEAERS